jgi:hypothetical protein
MSRAISRRSPDVPVISRTSEGESVSNQAIGVSPPSPIVMGGTARGLAAPSASRTTASAWPVKAIAIDPGADTESISPSRHGGKRQCAKRKVLLSRRMISGCALLVILRLSR